MANWLAFDINRPRSISNIVTDETVKNQPRSQLSSGEGTIVSLPQQEEMAFLAWFLHTSATLKHRVGFRTVQKVQTVLNNFQSTKLLKYVADYTFKIF